MTPLTGLVDGGCLVLCLQPLKTKALLCSSVLRRQALSRQSSVYCLGTTLLIDPEHYGLRMMTLGFENIVE